MYNAKVFNAIKRMLAADTYVRRREESEEREQRQPSTDTGVRDQHTK